jgi:hypothetical protein
MVLGCFFFFFVLFWGGGERRDVHDKDPAEPGGLVVGDVFVAEFDIGEEDLGDYRADLAQGGGEPVASGAVRSGEDFCGDLLWRCVR